MVVLIVALCTRLQKANLKHTDYDKCSDVHHVLRSLYILYGACVGAVRPNALQDFILLNCIMVPGMYASLAEPVVRIRAPASRRVTELQRVLHSLAEPTFLLVCASTRSTDSNIPIPGVRLCTPLPIILRSTRKTTRSDTHERTHFLRVRMCVDA